MFGFTHLMLKILKEQLGRRKVLGSMLLRHIMRKKAVFVVKYPTWLHGLQSYDLVSGVDIDYLHSLMLSVVKLL